MGMFDTIYINKNFLPFIKQVEENKYHLHSLQIKNFDNLLQDYHVDSDGKLFVDKIEYVIIQNDTPFQKGKWNPPFFQEEKSRERIFVPYTGIINASAFLMDYNDKKDEIFVTIDFNFIDGIIQGIGITKKIEVVSIENILERRKLIEKIKNKRNNDFSYKIYMHISKIITKITCKLNKIQLWIISNQTK
jgi:hypothetical protein